jgi:predicted naringenin-chalcone synthase
MILPAIAGFAVATVGFLCLGGASKPKRPTKVVVKGMGAAFPQEKYKQTDIRDAMINRFKGVFDEAENDFVRRVFDHSDIETCHIALPPDQLFEKFNREKYVQHIKTKLKDMGKRAAEAALAEWGGDRTQITHIIWGTMTGAVHAPTMDVELLTELRLSSSCKRLNVEGMGCLTGYRCLGLGHAMVQADPENHKVLVVVCDTRSVLQNQLQAHPDRSDVVVCALFRDSGGACVLTGDHDPTPSPPLYEVIEHMSHCVPNTFDYVALREKDPSVMTLYISKDVPVAVSQISPECVGKLLKKHNVDISQCALSLHTGGPKVLNMVGKSLGMKEGSDQLAASWRVMKERGNLSGASNLVVLDHIRRVEQTQRYPYVVCLSFGPGVCVEFLLLRNLTTKLYPSYNF